MERPRERCRRAGFARGHALPHATACTDKRTCMGRLISAAVQFAQAPSS
jgi:hypothetical protein